MKIRILNILFIFLSLTTLMSTCVDDCGPFGTVTQQYFKVHESALLSIRAVDSTKSYSGGRYFFTVRYNYSKF